MISADMLTVEDIAAMLKEVGVADTALISQTDFEAFVDLLTEEE